MFRFAVKYSAVLSPGYCYVEFLIEIIFSFLTLFIPVDFPFHFDTISMDLSIWYAKGSQVETPKF